MIYFTILKFNKQLYELEIQKNYICHTNHLKQSQSNFGKTH